MAIGDLFYFLCFSSISIILPFTTRGDPPPLAQGSVPTILTQEMVKQKDYHLTQWWFPGSHHQFFSRPYNPRLREYKYAVSSMRTSEILLGC